MRSHGPSCKRWRCSMKLLFHFPCWTWSITLNGKFSNHLSHHRHLLLCCPSSLPFFSRIFLSVQIGSCANQLIQCKVHEMFFPTNLHLPRMHSNWVSYAPFSRHCNLPRADFSTCISDVWDIAPPVGLQLYRLWMRWTEDLMEILNIQLSCIVNLWTCAQNWWGLAMSVLETWRCWWCSKFWARFPSSSFDFHVLHG